MYIILEKKKRKKEKVIFIIYVYQWEGEEKTNRSIISMFFKFRYAI